MTTPAPGKAGLSRRQFLGLCGLSLAGLAFQDTLRLLDEMQPWPRPATGPFGRVTRRSVDILTEPHPDSPRRQRVARDTLLRLVERVDSDGGPAHNPRWYRLREGFVHSAYIQRIDCIQLNPPLAAVPESGLLGEITVPFIQTQYQDRQGAWMPLYRLYYGSVHWVTARLDSPNGEPWYRVTDERLKIHTYLPAACLRPIPPEELTPLAPHVPDELKRVEISIAGQRLTAYEGSQVVFQAPVSTGRRYMETPTGAFQVQRKFPSRHMGDGWITADLRAYELVGVPWVTFFHPAGIALHGTFWHDNFGTPMSQGCVNLRNEDALWLFRWCGPGYNPQVTDRAGWKLVKDGSPIFVG